MHICEGVHACMCACVCVIQIYSFTISYFITILLTKILVMKEICLFGVKNGRIPCSVVLLSANRNYWAQLFKAKDVVS